METSFAPTGEPWDIAVRAFLVPDASALARRRANRHRRRAARRLATPSIDDNDDDASRGDAGHMHAGDVEGRAADDELQAIEAVLGPRPWLTLILDTDQAIHRRLI